LPVAHHWPQHLALGHGIGCVVELVDLDPAHAKRGQVELTPLAEEGWLLRSRGPPAVGERERQVQDRVQ
jgi:hypothetical protein